VFSAGAPMLDTLLALAATFLALSLFVQIIQEVYKYVTSSQASAYAKSLEDYLGPYARYLLQSGSLPDLKVRGPFQFRKIRPHGKLLPLGQSDLVEALERTIPPWHQRALQVLRLEARLEEQGAKDLSPEWHEFVGSLKQVEAGAPGYRNAQEVLKFVQQWEGQARPKAMSLAFRKTYAPQIDAAADNFPQLVRNFEYAYRRRNLRQTVILGFVVAAAFELPFEKLFADARALSPEQAARVAEVATAAYAQHSADSQQTGRTPEPDTAAIQAIRTVINTVSHRDAKVDYVVNWSRFSTAAGVQWRDLFRYLFGCLLTALLISFGAPLWNDIAKAVLRLRGGAERDLIAKDETREVSRS
jgi:hypothetical protein